MGLLYCFVNYTKKEFIGCEKLSCLPGTDACYWFCHAISYGGEWHGDSVAVAIHPVEDSYIYYGFTERKFNWDVDKIERR